MERLAVKLRRPAADKENMLRVASTLLSTGFCATSGHTALTLTSNGDTLLIVAETIACVLLMSALVYCRRKHRLQTE